MNLLRLLLVAGLAVACASCGGTVSNYGAAASVTAVRSGSLPEPSVEDLKASDRPYRVGPFDRLLIDVFGAEDLSGREVQVDASGRLSFPLIGTIPVAGQTPGEVEAQIAGLLEGRFVKSPQVTVNLKEIVSQTVSIGGEVKKPGLYPIVGRLTLMRAVATAEGESDFADSSQVMIFRTVGETEYVALYSLKAIQRGNYADPEVFANDVVIVGENNARRVFKDYVAPFIAPIILATERIANN